MPNIAEREGSPLGAGSRREARALILHPARRAAAALLLLVGCHPPAVASLPLHGADAIVVLGNRPPVDETGELRPELRRRLETGVALYRRGLAPRIVMTGGPAPGGVVEAEVMRDAAIAQGVPPSAIVVEGRSQDTIRNAGFTLALLCRNAHPFCTPDVIVVSSPYHLPRARDLFRCAGARVQLAPTGVPTDRGYRARFALRERIVAIYYGTMDPCAATLRARENATRNVRSHSPTQIP